MTTFAPSASVPTPATSANRPFMNVPTGTYEAVCVAASAQYALEDLAAALRAASEPLHPLVAQHLDAARAAVDAASDCWMSGFPC